MIYIANAGTFSFFGFENFLIAKKKMVEDVTAPRIVENVRAMPSPPETPSSGKMDTPSEATPLAQCNLSIKRKADQEECFPTEFSRLNYLFLL